MLHHWTRTEDSLFSILKYGFFYLHNETGILSKLFGARILAENNVPSGGMICFTDHKLGDSAHIRNKFGTYGIAVKKDWAISKGASKVLYVDDKTPVYASIKKVFETYFPEEFRGWGVDETQSHLDNLATSLVMTNPALLEQGNRPIAYVELMKLVAFSQTIEEYAESEWRIRSPYSVAMVGPDEGATIKGYIQIIIEAIETCLTNNHSNNVDFLDLPDEDQFLNGRMPPKNSTNSNTPENRANRILGLALPLSIDSIEYIFVPNDDLSKIKRKIDRYKTRLGKSYKGIRVRGY